MAFSISLIIPAYNEGENLARCVEETHSFLGALGADFEIIVVDDGSADGTPELCRRLAGRFSALSFIRHPVNRGIGGAIRTGFGAARKELLFYLPADNQMDITELPLYLEKIGGADIVAGRRINREVTLSRLFLSRVYNWMLRAMYGIKVRDVGWVKLIRRETAERLKLASDSASIDAEMLVKAGRLGMRVVEVDVHERPRTSGRAKGADLSRITRLFFDVIALRTKV